MTVRPGFVFDLPTAFDPEADLGVRLELIDSVLGELDDSAPGPDVGARQQDDRRVIELSPTVEQFVYSDADVCIVFSARGEGKALQNGTLVLTPAGWVKVEDIRVGETVIASDGTPTEVLGVYAQPSQPLWKLQFSDGTSAVTTREHLWTVRDTMGGGRPWRTLSTQEIRARLDRHWAIPILTASVQFHSRPVPIDPYLLGLLLGDGCMTGRTDVRLAATEPFLIDAARQALPLGADMVRDTRWCWRFVGATRSTRRDSNPVLSALRELNLYGCKARTKFVPPLYLWNSADVRAAVLQGLLDTDGYANKRNGVEFTSASPHLIEAVRFLVRSLGGLANVPHWDHAASRLSITLPQGIPPFRLPRKLARVRPRRHHHGRVVIRIDAAGEGASTCLSVAHASGLFVIHDFVVTHNTTGGVARILRVAQDNPGTTLRVACVRDTYVNLRRTVFETLQQGNSTGWWDAEFRQADSECLLNGHLAHLFFFGMDRAADANRFQGFEAGLLWLEEPAPAADISSGIPAEVFAMGVSSLRQPGITHPTVQITMNPPDRSHWTLELAETLEEAGHAHMRVEVFRIPVGENIHLPPGYRERMRLGLEAAQRPDLIRRLSEGNIGTVIVGVPVTPEFSDLHVAKKPIEIKLGWPTYRAWDFGLMPAVVWGQVTPMGHLNIIGSIQGVNMGIEELIEVHVIPWEARMNLRNVASSRAKRPRDDYGHVKTWSRARTTVRFRDIGDPAGAQREQTNSERSAARMLENLLHTTFEKAPVEWSARRNSMRAVLTRNIGGRPMLQIDPECVPLIEALEGRWRHARFPSGQVSPLPVKDMASHVGDAFGYLCAKLYPSDELTRRALAPPPSQVRKPASWVGR